MANRNATDIGRCPNCGAKPTQIAYERTAKAVYPGRWPEESHLNKLKRPEVTKVCTNCGAVAEGAA